MKSYLLTATLISLALLVAGCQPVAEQPDPAAEATKQAEDIAAIKKLWDDFAVVLNANAGDVGALAAFFTDDAVRMAHNQPADIGKEAIQASLQRAYGEFTVKLIAEVLEVEVAGDWAFARGTYTRTLTPKAGGEATEGRGKYLVIHQRQPDGSWKIHRNIRNSDQPLPGAGE